MALHLFFMGYKGWMNPERWHTGIPPISFVAFTAFVIGYVINIAGRKHANIVDISSLKTFIYQMIFRIFAGRKIIQ